MPSDLHDIHLKSYCFSYYEGAIGLGGVLSTFKKWWMFNIGTDQKSLFILKKIACINQYYERSDLHTFRHF